MLQSEESRQNSSRSFWGGENEEETSVRKVEKGVREQSGNSREILRRKWIDVFWRDLMERSA
jgi:hypothetical protein